MAEMSSKKWLIIVLTFMVGFILEALPSPTFIKYLIPNWTLLILIYWSMTMPNLVNLGSAFTVGIFLDLLSGTLLGEHALAMLIICFIVIKIHRVILVYPLIQQIFVIALLTLAYQIIIFIIQGIIHQMPNILWFWLATITSALIWPWLFVILNALRKKYLSDESQRNFYYDL